MGIKKFFKTKPPSQEEVESNIRERMSDRGIPIKSDKKKPSVFEAYSKFANDKTKKKVYAPKGYEQYAQNNRGEKVFVPGYDEENLNDPTPDQSASGNSENLSNPSNPYGSISPSNSQNPYSSLSDSKVTGSNGYDSGQNSANPYASLGSQGDIYNSQVRRAGSVSANSYQQDQQSLSTNLNNPYSSQRHSHEQKPQKNPYSSPNSRQSNHYNSSSANRISLEDDLNYVERDEESIRPVQQQFQLQTEPNADYDDLNEVVEDNYQYQEQPLELTEEELAQKEEDEDVERIKNQIRFTKQESVASTRNTLRMARQAEEAGQNTVGMFGAQSEMLYNIEANLSLAETQDRIAKEKIGQLHHYNRHILKPSIQNPFTKSRRLREQEDRIKGERIQSKLESEQQRRELSNSTNRLKAGLNETDQLGQSIQDKYRQQKIVSEAKRYQFENDSEDDEMERELGENLDDISKVTARLKKLAQVQSEEVDRQNYRLRDIEEKADRLDINVHLNTSSLSRMR